jgi:probable HAF family extracellular repeat protein
MSTKIVTVPLFVCLISALAVSQSAYIVTDLGPLSPTAINSWAQVVGNYNNQAYIWSFGRMKALGLLPAGTFSQAAAINDFGAVTGTADGAGMVISPDLTISPNQICSSGLVQPFLWTRENGMEGLNTVGWEADNLLCIVPFYGTGINNSGQIVGDMPDGPGLYAWGFVWTNSSGMSLFGGSWIPSFVGGINNNNQIVGQNSDELDEGYATSWQNGVTTDLGALIEPLDPTAAGSAANGVNDSGQVVGWSSTIPNEYTTESIVHAVLWSPAGVIQDLGTLPGDQFSAALKINSSGEIVGASGNTASKLYAQPLQVTGRPFISTARNGMHDLNTLISSTSGWVLNTATDINVWGQIVGQGTRNGQPHGYLLTPRNPFQVF